MSVNDFDAKKSAHCSQVLAVSELVVSGTQCMHIEFRSYRFFGCRTIVLFTGNVVGPIDLM